MIVKAKYINKQIEMCYQNVLYTLLVQKKNLVFISISIGNCFKMHEEFRFQLHYHVSIKTMYFIKFPISHFRFLFYFSVVSWHVSSLRYILLVFYTSKLLYPLYLCYCIYGYVEKGFNSNANTSCSNCLSIVFLFCCQVSQIILKKE